MHTVSDSTPSIQDSFSRNGATALDGSPEAELDDAQRAALEYFYADDQPTDEDIDRMYAESKARAAERELEDIAAEFKVAYERYITLVAEYDIARAEQQAYENAARALGAA